MRDREERPAGRLLTFRSGGWVLLLAVVGVGIILAEAIRTAYRAQLERIGDGENVSSYQFDLETTLIPREEIAAAHLPRDGVRPIDAPEILTRKRVETEADGRGRKLLVPDDLVIGVAISGEARAYPLRILNWHEVVNDTLSGREILVTFHPLTRSTAVFDRLVAGEVLEFGTSGLVWNSCPLLYDRRPGAEGESLWCQLQARAVAGPAAKEGRTLSLVPSALASWEEWKTLNPDTTVIAPRPGLSRHYLRRPYSNYYGTRSLRFPVAPYPPPKDFEAWGEIVAEDGRVVPLTQIPGGVPRAAIRAFWWAWFATRPLAVVERE